MKTRIKKKVRPHKKFYIRDQVYGANTLVVAGLSQEKAKILIDKWMGWRSGEEPADRPGAYAYVTYDDKRPKRFGVWFEEFKPGVGTVTHELFHLVFHCFHQSGLELSPTSQEAYAYYLESLVRTVGEELWWRKKPKKQARKKRRS